MLTRGPRGRSFPLYFLGSKMHATYPLGPLFHNQSLNIALLSYDGRLHWGLNADNDTLPDVKQLTAAARISFEQMKAAAAAA